MEDQPPTFVSFTPSILSPRHQHLFTKFLRDIALYIKNIELAVELPRPYTVDAAHLKDKGRGIVIWTTESKGMTSCKLSLSLVFSFYYLAES